MYRNISYTIDRDNGWEGQITLFTWDKDGKKVRYSIPHQSYLYHKDNRGSEYSIFGDKIKKKYFQNVSTRKHWLNSNKEVDVFECLDPKTEFLQNYFYNKNTNIEEFQQYPLHVCYLDIEVAIEKDFPEPSEALFPINLITFYDSFEDKFYVFTTLEKYKKKRKNVVFKRCQNEKELISSFIDAFKSKEFDMLCTFNGFTFDVPYLVNRGKKLLGDDKVNELSPVGNVYCKKLHLQVEGTFFFGYEIDGISHIDYLLLYKIFTIPFEGRKESYSLNNIAQDEIGRGKIKYEGNFKQLYSENPELFIEYNIEDVQLIIDIEKKRQFFPLMRLICNLALVEYEKITSSLALLVGNFTQYSKAEKIHLNSVVNYEKLKELEVSYTGAYVMCEPGMYNSVFSVDVASLYPNIMIANNISPETLVGKIIRETNNKVDLLLHKTREVKEIKKDKFEELLKTGNYSITANKVLFSNKKDGVIPLFLESLFNKRLKMKKEKKSTWKKLEQAKQNKDKNLIKELKDKYLQVDLYQNALKICLNSVYGLQGNKYSPFFNIDVAEGITLTGQKIVKSAGKFLSQYIQKHYPAQTDKKIHVYTDTDSAYINGENISEYKFKNKNFEKNMGKVIHEIDRKIVPSLNKWTEMRLMPQVFKAKRPDRINFVRESFCETGYFFMKKRYILYVRDDEGEEVDKIKYTGVSIKRSTYPPFIKNTLKDFYEQSIKEKWNEEKYLTFLDDLYKDFKTKDIEEIALCKGLTKFKEPLDFLKVDKGTSGHCKAAIFHNQLVEKMNLKNKYDLIKNGQIRVCYIKQNNPYNINIIAFGERYPKEFSKIFEIDYKKMFKLLITQCLEHFVKINDWNEFDFNNYCCNIMDI